MATDIIKQLRASKTPIATIAGVTIDKTSPMGDEFHGSAEALIAAGLITADQLPGRPGMPKVAATFYHGVLRNDRRHIPRDSGYLNICRPSKGKKITVRLGGLSDEERAMRLRTVQTEMGIHRPSQSIVRDESANSVEAFRDKATCLLVELLMLGCAAHRIHADSYPFELAAEDGGRLPLALRHVMSIFDSGKLRPVGGDRAQIDAARNDDAFQSFLRLQCIPADRGDHA
ncbi:hypothetical protein J2789_005764 [Variovorax paradoxus]|uniref:hypothetical protein n=1 Tax=Variovorax atrisoli TaxID=3394203 RepID=UPI00119C5D92|nr:hypothetical protein [Variovorax paradoxus]MDR6523074.1 hypothetical protein [Variovorax paradoxus]